MAATTGADAAAEEREFELERLALAGFVDLLAKEQHALAGNDADALEPLSAEKLRRLDQLGRHAERRNERLRHAGHSPDAQGMRDWLAARTSSPGIAAAWERVIDLARKAREQNELNGRLLTLHMQRTSRQLEFLNRMSSNEPVYEADGVARSAVHRRSLGEA